jgi:hypothetical protein
MHKNLGSTSDTAERREVGRWRGLEREGETDRNTE